MKTRVLDVVRTAMVGLLALSAVALPGCRPDEPSTELMSVKGKIDHIRLIQNRPGVIGEVTVRFQSEKHADREVTATGLVVLDTEIQINGVIARLEDVREGEYGRADVRVDKKGNGEPTYTVVKMYVERAKPIGEGGG
ncbi:MAG TPA: hypothetical protein PKK06_11585 [Phycisphaerae bacterium]|nr:hypothetical protein [Phycisphaerae bacterium]HNU45897.1 hypothetical protein [Phycisphaerae bacterium]